MPRRSHAHACTLHAVQSCSSDALTTTGPLICHYQVASLADGGSPEPSPDLRRFAGLLQRLIQQGNTYAGAWLAPWLAPRQLALLGGASCGALVQHCAADAPSVPPTPLLASQRTLCVPAHLQR